jgi:hypothetical protein
LDCNLNITILVIQNLKQITMKKLIALLIIVFALAFSTQDANAQQRPEDAAKIQVAALSETLELNGDEQRALFRVFVKKEAAYARQVTGQDLSNPTVVAAKKEIDSNFEKELKAVLTPEQYKRYKASIE